MFVAPDEGVRDYGPQGGVCQGVHQLPRHVVPHLTDNGHSETWKVVSFVFCDR